MLAWIGLCSWFSSQVSGKVRELAIDTGESGSLKRFLDRLFQFAGDKAFQPAKAHPLQHVNEAIDLAAAAGGGFRITSHEAQLGHRFRVDTVSDGSLLVHAYQRERN